MDEEKKPEEITPTPREQLDKLVSGAQASFDNSRLQLAGQEGFIAGLKQARDLWDASIMTQSEKTE